MTQFEEAFEELERASKRPPVARPPRSVPMLRTVSQVQSQMLSIQETTRDAVRSVKVDTSVREKPGMVYDVWKKAMGVRGEWVPEMNGTIGGQWKAFAALLPQGSARSIVATAVDRWDGFKSVVESDYGAYKVSATPSFNAMRLHVGALVTWWRHEQDGDRAHAAKAQTYSNPAQDGATAVMGAPDPLPPAPPDSEALARAAARKAEKALQVEIDRFQQLVDIEGLGAATETWLSAHPAIPVQPVANPKEHSP